MGFVGRPNKALANMGLKDQNWSHFWKESKPWRERERKREEEEKKKKKGRSSSKAPLRYGNYFEYGSNLGYELYYESHGFCMGF